MSVVVTVGIPGRRYDVVIGAGLLGSTGSLLVEILGKRNVAVISDQSVASLFGEQVLGSLRDAGCEATLLTVAPGEASKSWETAGDLLERLAAAGMDRESVVVALGGGVVGDLAGFCAGVYMRGVPFVQVPTTLLAQVDSSVGGKTAVDLRAGKNLAGVFVQPSLVVADTSTMTSLPRSEWRSGLAEVVKSGLLDGESLVEWMESNAEKLAIGDDEAVAHAVQACVAFKGRIVVADEREQGQREWLNYGHTLGHAIEKVAGYGTFTHGAAVAEGMRFAARLAERIAGASPEFTARQERLLDAVGLQRIGGGFDADAIRSAMSSDKKSRGGVPRFVLLVRPGEVMVTRVEEQILAEELARWAQSEREAKR